MRYTSAEAGTSKKKRKSELLELWLCLTRSMIGVTTMAVLTGGFFARGVKNESRHRCGFIVSISHGEKKPKTSSLANMRLQPKREEVIGNSSSQKESFEILLGLLPSCFSVIVSLTGGGEGGASSKTFFFLKLLC